MARERNKYDEGLTWAKDYQWGTDTRLGYPHDLNLYRSGTLLAWVRPEKGGYRAYTLDSAVNEVYTTRRHAMRVAFALALTMPDHGEQGLFRA